MACCALPPPGLCLRPPLRPAVCGAVPGPPRGDGRRRRWRHRRRYRRRRGRLHRRSHQRARTRQRSEVQGAREPWSGWSHRWLLRPRRYLSVVHRTEAALHIKRAGGAAGAADHAAVLLVGARRAQGVVSVVRLDHHMARGALGEPGLRRLASLLRRVVQAAVLLHHWGTRQQWRLLGRHGFGRRRRCGGRLLGLGHRSLHPWGRDRRPLPPAALAHRLQQDAGEGPVGFQRQPLKDHVQGLLLHAVRGVGDDLGQLAEAALPEVDHHRSADGIHGPALLDLLQELRLVYVEAQVVVRPQHRPGGGRPTPVCPRPQFPHLLEDLRHELVAHPGPQRLRALPGLDGLVADVELAVPELPEQEEAPRLAVDIEVQLCLVQTVPAAGALHCAHLPDLRHPAGRPDRLEVARMLRAAAHKLRRLDHQHDVPQQSAGRAKLQQAAGAAHEEDVAGGDYPLQAVGLLGGAHTPQDGSTPPMAVSPRGRLEGDRLGTPRLRRRLRGGPRRCRHGVHAHPGGVGVALRPMSRGRRRRDDGAPPGGRRRPVPARGPGARARCWRGVPGGIARA
mmetsp:Transcript_48797/g.145791  ORF Transcript_48797/g.145791 Transcript_48797/m.145791 type:complete len:564 (+) Transcript_48797:858-2549(+)